VTDIPTTISAISLFVEDVAEAKAFYVDVFRLPVHFEDEASAVFRFGSTLVNLLDVREAPELVSSAPVGTADAGVRAQFTITVEDVDATVAELGRRGVTLLSGPIDRPWGIRTASFRDPAGHIWEVAGQPDPTS
jgi:lactoylglutathione lyase